MAAIQAAAAEPSAAKAAAAWETDMSIWNAIILGLVQGIAEFLPISSSGHLAILQNLMGLKTAEGGGYVFFDVLLHLGTLISICIVYWSEIVSMVRETVLFFKRSSTPEQKEHLPAARELLMIVIATLPLFLILPVKDKIEGLYYNTLFVGCALIATGAILFFSDRRKAPGKKGARSMTLWDAVLIGCCQAVATAPGISRSGTTIAGGLVRGLNRSFAVNFSFLMSVPAVLGANILSLHDALKVGINAAEVPAYLVGMAVAMVAGVFAIRIVKKITSEGKFGNFAYYCWAVGLLSVILSLVL
jgi:undecaprenyl-diphosphatase